MPDLATTGPAAVDQFVKEFEAARAYCESAAIEQFLPPTDHPLYPAAVRELVRVDLELGWDRGRPRSVDDYRRTFPTVFRDPAALAAVAFEEYRQRREHGEDVRPGRVCPQLRRAHRRLAGRRGAADTGAGCGRRSGRGVVVVSRERRRPARPICPRRRPTASNCSGTSTEPTRPRPATWPTRP